MKRKFQKGHFFIGDPFLVLDDYSWEQIKRSTNNFTDKDQNFENLDLAVSSVSELIGTIIDNYCEEYEIESGYFGIIPLKIINISDDDAAEMGQVVDFETDFTVEVSDGKFIFGDIVIDTNDDIDNDYEDGFLEEDTYC